MSARLVTLSPTASRSPCAQAKQRKKETSDGLGSLTSARPRGSPVADNKMHDLPLPFARATRGARARRNESATMEATAAPRQARETYVEGERGRECTTLFTQRHDATLRKATRVTFERQDDAMNYKMTVKAKVSGGFADTREKDRERPTVLQV